MFVLINGAFGIGKTAVASELRRQLPRAAIFDPERVGFVIQRLPGYAHDDFQDAPSWRRMTIAFARALATIRPVVIMPMAFSELRYLDEIRAGLAASGRPVLHFCLVAPLQVVQSRLAGRGESRLDQRWSWVHRRAEECCIAHAGREFAVHLPADIRAPRAIAAEIADRVRMAA